MRFMDPRPVPSTARIVLALLSVYLIWGSTYVAILFAIDTIPPLTMAGVRFTLAGGVLYALTRARGGPAPRRVHWGSAALIGFLLLSVKNGGVTWAEQYVPSGLTALILAGIPAWMVLFDWARPRGRSPLRQEVLGVGLGLVGIALLVSGAGDPTAPGLHPGGTFVLLLASLSWAFGSIVSRGLSVPDSAIQLTAMQMLLGGVFLLVGGAVTGEWSRIDPAGISLASLLALGYLIVFGSWLGFTAYVWLLRSTTPAVASSYAFVNPVIAVILGWLLVGESIGAATLVAMVVIVIGVALIVLRPRRTPGPGLPRVAPPPDPVGPEPART